MAGMWIVHVDVKDDNAYAKYVNGSSQVVSDHGGAFIARGGRYQTVEGKEYPRNVVVRFPTYQDALDAYASEEYQAIVGIATEASERSFTILEIDD